MKEHSFNIFLNIAILLVAGFLIINKVQQTVSMAITPIMSQVQEIQLTQNQIQQQINEERKDRLQFQFDLLNARISVLENKPSNYAQAPSQYPSAPSQPQQPQNFNTVYNIPIGNTPVMGPSNAPVTITAFLDFQCPFCNRFYPAVKDVFNAYKGKVKVVVKNFPLSFHPNALPAAKLALAANEQGKYYPMIDLLMQNGGDVSDAKVKEYANKLGLNYNKLIRDYTSLDAQWQQRITDDTNLGNQVGVRGTPTFYINGKQTTARDLASYKAEIDKILGS